MAMQATTVHRKPAQYTLVVNSNMVGHDFLTPKFDTCLQTLQSSPTLPRMLGFIFVSSKLGTRPWASQCASMTFLQQLQIQTLP
jgi:hypothetical protein